MNMNINNNIFTFENGITLYFYDNGLNVYFPYYQHYVKNNEDIQPSFKQHIGDKWIFDFSNSVMASVIAEVKNVEIANGFLQPYSSYDLCFGNIFTEEQIKQMKMGNVSFRKIVNNAPMENGIYKEEIIEKLKKIEEQQNILRDAIKNGESLSEVAKKNNINLVKLGD